MNINWKMLGGKLLGGKALKERLLGEGASGEHLLGMKTISQRLVLLFALLLGGFVMVGAAYWGIVAVNDSADTTSERVSEFGFVVDRIESGVLQARRTAA